jgi:hypothetical protein
MLFDDHWQSTEVNIINAAEQLRFDDAAHRSTLTFKPVFYHTAQKVEALQNLALAMKIHPTSQSSKELLFAAESKTEHHGFLGLAHGREPVFFGLRHHNHYVAFIGLNQDQLKEPEHAISFFYHAVSHALDTYNIIHKNNLKLTNSDFILLPKRNQMSVARSNLRADIFSSFMTAGHYDDSADTLVALRASQSLTTQPYIRPEEFPFPIAVDVVKLAQTRINQFQEKKAINAHHLASRVVQTFDKNSIAAWIGFAAPAQTLAWSGYDERTILSLAIHSSPNPLIKSNGHLIADILNIQPSEELANLEGFNPFVGRDVNRQIHKQKADEIFEIALIHALETDTAEPLIRTANNQNQDLLKGKMIGWCANALQAAGNAFLTAQVKGVSPDQATRMMFEGQKSIPDWNGLNDLNNFIIAQRRQGFGVTFDDVTSYCKRNSDMYVVVESVENTMKDPVFAQTLAMANAMPQPPKMAMNIDHGYKPQAPQPQVNLGFVQAPNSPMGGGMMAVPQSRVKIAVGSQSTTQTDDRG